MNTKTPDKAFILAAGLGTRLRPYTNDRPKPLVKVAGKTLLDRTLDHLCAANIHDITANTHYLPDQIKTTLNARTDIAAHISHEPELLDTGGGIKKMLHRFDAPFYVLSGDGLWDNAGDQNTLQDMAAAWNPDTMDILIVLQPVSTMTLTKGIGDYDLDKNGRAIRAMDKTGQYMFTSMRINHPRIFDQTPDGAFSYLDLLDKAQQNGRLYGMIHRGDWHHISTPDDLETVDEFYQKRSSTCAKAQDITTKQKDPAAKPQDDSH
ncbi:MAG: nucleotidyltransferase family protein [Bdellovibrionales bacterium]